MLLPMEALAAGAPSNFTYSISMWLSDGYGAQLGTNTDPSTGKCKWEDIGEVLIGNGTYSVQSDADGHMSLEGDASSSYVGKYLSSDGQSAVLATDIIPEEGSTIFLLTSLPLDFTAPESLAMKVTQGHSDLTIDPCVITNTGSEDLKLSKVEITAASGWTVVNASTDFTTANSKNKIAFTAGGHDFADGAYTPGEIIAAGTNTTLQLAGKISEKADLTNATQVASMVLTVEKASPTIITFTISIAGVEDYSYQAEKGMTWDEWIASEYNTDGFTDVDYRWTIYEGRSITGSDVIVEGYTYIYYL